MTIRDEVFMQRCLDLARNGLGSTAPNPMVGAVIVHEGRIIGEGFHQACGQAHAEVNAVNKVGNPDLFEKSTLYVNLEPCNHQGRTPPCTELILQKKIPKVVIGQADPNPLVAGSGLSRLLDKGVEVITGVLEKESRFLNRRFNMFHEQKRPYLILKWAQTRDGFVDTLRNETGKERPTWITDDVCRRLVHKWRSEEPAILTGSNTVLMDNPQLNVRAWSGKDPVRITIDRQGRIPLSFNLLDQTVPTLIYTCTDKSSKPNLEFIRICPDEPVWPQVLGDLYKRDIQSVLIEGGPTLFKTLIDAGLWDEVRVFTGPGWLGCGVKAPEFPYAPAARETIGNSEVTVFYRT
ncbi:MAG: bifunctional diaminohydroxyphosphoribosylaminopyrimidine deaminase/5-amino-6-(5-phosphoribosylamino)uracil reductase RibD [Bacteroidota bacterium]